MSNRSSPYPFDAVQCLVVDTPDCTIDEALRCAGHVVYGDDQMARNDYGYEVITHGAVLLSAEEHAALKRDAKCQPSRVASISRITQRIYETFPNAGRATANALAIAIQNDLAASDPFANETAADRLADEQQ